MEEAPTSTLRLIRRIEAGEREAFSALFVRFRRRLLVLIHYKLGPQLAQFTSARDLLQETYLRAYRDFDRFSYTGSGSFMHWLSAIADHVVADQARYMKRGKRRFTANVRFRSKGNPSGAAPADSRIPSRDLEEKEAVGRLMRDLDLLPEEYRQVLILARIQGLKVSEIACQTGRTPNAVSLQLHRALRRFRELRGGGGGDGNSD